MNPFKSKKFKVYSVVVLLFVSAIGLYAFYQHTIEEEKRADTLVKNCVGAYRFYTGKQEMFFNYTKSQTSDFLMRTCPHPFQTVVSPSPWGTFEEMFVKNYPKYEHLL